MNFLPEVVVGHGPLSGQQECHEYKTKMKQANKSTNKETDTSHSLVLSSRENKWTRNTAA